MILFFLRKGVTLLFSLWCVVTATFFLMHALPGDPFISERPLPEELLRSLYAYYGLDRPLWVQYLDYLGKCARGDLGLSMIYEGRSVTSFIRETLPISFQLGAQALALSVPIGIALGTFAAWRVHEWQDHLATGLATIGISMPNFVLSSLLQYFLCFQLHLLPIARWGTFAHTILPTIALAAMPCAFVTRLTRSSMLSVLRQDFIKTAKAKGLSPLRILFHHAMRSALLPVVSYLGPAAAHILTGTFAVEKIFAIPGLGQWMIHSILQRDYPMIAGLTLFFSACLLITNFFVEVAYTILDPRIRLRYA